MPHCQTQQNLGTVVPCRGLRRGSAHRRDDVGGPGVTGLGTVGPRRLLLFSVRPASPSLLAGAEGGAVLTNGAHTATR